MGAGASVKSVASRIDVMTIRQMRARLIARDAMKAMRVQCEMVVPAIVTERKIGD